MATVTSTPTADSLSVSGTTSKSGTISWTAPTVPSGATITSCVLTGTATASMTLGSATITVNGSSVTSGQTFTVDLGTANTTTSVATTAKGASFLSFGTVTFSDLVYTVVYEESSGGGDSGGDSGGNIEDPGNVKYRFYGAESYCIYNNWEFDNALDEDSSTQVTVGLSSSYGQSYSYVYFETHKLDIDFSKVKSAKLYITIYSSLATTTLNLRLYDSQAEAAMGETGNPNLMNNITPLATLADEGSLTTTAQVYEYDILNYFEDLCVIFVGARPKYSCDLYINNMYIEYTYEEPIEEESVSNISIGNITLNQVYMGEQEIQEIYLGDNLLFKK